MRVLITGAAGQIGWRLAHFLREKHHVVATLRSGHIGGLETVEMDVTEPLSIRLAVDRTEPDMVVHCAAMTDADECEREKKACWHINVEGTRALAEECANTGTRMIYVSTDLIFDGEKGNYTEADVPNPLSYYALSKLEGEKAVASILPSATIARIAIVYGLGGMPARGFALWVLESLRQGKKIQLLTDQIRSHFYLGDCVRALGGILEGAHTGIFHLSPGRKESRYDFGVAVATALGLDTGLIEPVTLNDLPSDARRPKDVSLSNVKLARETGFVPTPFGETLEMLKKEFVVG